MSVPSMRWASTTMSTVSGCTSIGLHERVFGDRSGAAVDAAKMHGGASRDRRVRIVGLGRARMHQAQARVGAERTERRHFRTARAADAPGLLEHAAVPASLPIAPAQHVVVPA